VKVSGTHDLAAPPAQVWAALTEPAVLARTIPGALALERIGADEYRVTVEAGVASIRGVYDGVVALGDLDPHRGYTLRASGSGAPGTIDATCAITLTPAGAGGTRVTYEADAAVGGTVAGVGQRVLAGVAKRTAAQFFSAVETELTAPAPPPGSAEAGAPARPGAPGATAGPGGPAGPGAAPDAGWAVDVGGAAAADAGWAVDVGGVVDGGVAARVAGPGAGGGPLAAPAPAGVGAVFAGRARAGAAPPPALAYLVGAVVGAAIALAGVLVGRRSA